MQKSDIARLLLLAALWGASFMFMRVASPAFGAINTAFLRVFFGFCGLSVILLTMGVSFRFDGKMKWVLLLGVVNSGLPFLMYCIAAQLLPAGYSAILNATTPMMGVMIGALFFAEALTLKKSAGVITGLCGIVLITSTGNASEIHVLIPGMLCCLLATACYGTAGFLTRRWIHQRGGLDARTLAMGSQLGATLFLLPFFIGSLISGPQVHWAQSSAWFSVLAVGLLCTAAAYILYFRLLASIGPLRSLTVTFLIPPFGVLWGWLFLDEALSGRFFMGAAVICLAVWLVITPSRAERASQPMTK
ncbi:EamA family transporter [Erwinia sp. OLTSP20]|uniref:DMT family transporter n=1 Tax=unclassified Erwinia TaxID=2622719 RepID=UPI000C179227|nr:MULTISPECIES: DMT family transporter [unclassified Erwinia]PIJ50369.1 EamA family transporter [Erwinia sp. OAMSP11]PIJ71628.1 multidrug DMT transporter permease [Erwinia sp. OLSSP12]PIJ81012.1 multidrug DMT transporter permease [Erwinia sp. OLCASP19]PIJ83270.1 multidrug DMT transporter permease [Erwinia sp. OLMTSP26]PIJ85950.1 multidrug DMT transporter permease [Erwinia sp. OLMDSP33]